MKRILTSLAVISLLTVSNLSGQVTPPEELSAAPGFEVDLVYTVPKESQGSWVALTVMRDGRLVASDQGGQGIYLIDVSEDAGDAIEVSKIDLDISAAQGMVDTEDGLYVNVHGRGMFLLKDNDGDNEFDEIETLTPMRGGGEHGQHALILNNDGKSLFVVAGNHTDLPAFEGVRTGGPWDEDLLLPREWDARGHARGKMAPGGWITQFDLETRQHEVYSIGYRNQYDVALNSYGDLFTFDADMEWDMGMPWYRPTRICHAVSGSEFGWRSGTGKWPAYYEDSLPPIVDIGPASPTGVTMGAGAKFPARYQQAVYALDWTFGIVYAIHLQPEGASYSGDTEIFVSGRLPVTDAVVGHDGHMYFTTGGRGVDSALYRVRYTGDESIEPAGDVVMDEATAAAHELRRSLETYHIKQDAAAIDAAWPHLSSTDRFVRYAARLAVEAQPVATWRSRVFSESDPQALITSAVALARCGEESDHEPLIRALGSLNIADLNEGQQLGLMRAYALAFIRTGYPTPEEQDILTENLLTVFPSDSQDLNTELIRMLVYLKADDVVGPAMDAITNRPPTEPPAWTDIARRNNQYGGPIMKMIENQPPSREIGYAFMLRNLRQGWSIEQRRAYLSFLEEAAGAAGGNSYTGFLNNLRNDFLGNCSNVELEQLSDLSGVSYAAEPDFEVRTPQGPGQEWTMADAAPIVNGGNLRNASFENGRALFHGANCAVCHRFAGLGGDIGPDLTSVKNKFSSQYILEALIDPSKDISDQYSALKVQLSDGRLITGIVSEDSEGNLVVYPATREGEIESIVVSKDDIEAMAPSAVSQMPDALLNNMSAEEIRDLVAYIMSAGDENAGVYGR
ncbi:MAG: c-type cytochrome [Planctomycetota bacterium]